MATAYGIQIIVCTSTSYSTLATVQYSYTIRSGHLMIHMSLKLNLNSMPSANSLRSSKEREGCLSGLSKRQPVDRLSRLVHLVP
jgi:hypothetical protein